MPSVATLSTIGLVLSVYAVYVEYKMEHKEEEDEFSALCDIEQIGASCSSVFQLPEGKMLSYFGVVPSGHALDVPNAALGIGYYLYMLLLSQRLPVIATQVVSSMALTSSIFLAYQLTILRELCILCWTSHVINSWLWWKTVRMAASSIQEKKKQN